RRWTPAPTRFRLGVSPHGGKRLWRHTVSETPKAGRFAKNMFSKIRAGVARAARLTDGGLSDKTRRLAFCEIRQQAEGPTAQKEAGPHGCIARQRARTLSFPSETTDVAKTDLPS